MNRYQALTGLFMLIALIGCAPVGYAPGHTPTAPYSQDDNEIMPEHGGGDSGGGGGSAM